MWKKLILGTGICLLALIIGYQISFFRQCKQQADSLSDSDISSSVPVDQKAERVTRDTCIIMESYDVSGALVERTECSPGAELMGNNRLDMLIYAKEYREHASDTEKKKGLERMVVESFSPEQVTLAKYYGEPPEEQGYILAVKDNAVIVYMTDRETIYEYTNIELWMLPQEIQSALVEGIHVENERELFDFLQTYSS